jgi:hypothetical protein
MAAPGDAKRPAFVAHCPSERNRKAVPTFAALVDEFMKGYRRAVCGAEHW